MVEELNGPEFDEIPDAVKKEVEKKVRREVFDLLHLEAVQRGDRALVSDTLPLENSDEPWHSQTAPLDSKTGGGT